MKQKIGSMKAVFTAVLGFSILAMASCGLGDWRYPLPNGYEVTRINSASVTFSKTTKNNQFDIIIDRFVVAVCYNESYIGVKRINMDDKAWDYDFEILELMEQTDPSEFEYYLMDSSRDTLYGPYTQDEYEVQCENLPVGEMCDWVSTTTWPEGAK